jgi:hypothetical protein
MSLLSSFITNRVLAALEAEFIKHEPQLQAAFLLELSNGIEEVLQWVNEKLTASNPSAVPDEPLIPVVDPAQ